MTDMTKTVKILKEMIGNYTSWYRGDYHSVEVSQIPSESGVRLKVFDICTDSISHTIDVFPNNEGIIKVTKNNGEVTTTSVNVPKSKKTIKEFYEKTLFGNVVRNCIIDDIPEDIRNRYKK